MIRLWIPSFYDDDKARYSNTRAVDDGENYEIIGCSCGDITMKLINGLKEHNIRSPYLHITKLTYDNYCGIREIINDGWFSPKGLYCPNPEAIQPKVVKNELGHKRVFVEILNLMAIIEDAQKRNIPVTYLEDGMTIEHGDIKIQCYINEVDEIGEEDDDGLAYIKDNAVCYWLPDLKYLATSDGCKNISKMCADKNMNPSFLKLPNHGKGITWEDAQQLKRDGVLYCWDNGDDSTAGKKNCIQSGITYLDCHKDINVAFASGKGIISVDGKDYVYDVPYNNGRFEQGWVKNFDGWWYRYGDGSWATGWKLINWRGEDTWFYFDDSGYSVSGWQYLPYDIKGNKNWFYFDPIHGNVRAGWLEYNGLWYYFDAYTGMHKGWLDYEGKKCYFEPNGDDKSPAYYNRIALIDGEIWEFDKNCYGKAVVI